MTQRLAAILGGMALALAGCGGSPPTLYGAADREEVVVLAHGLGRSGHALWRLSDQLEQAGFLVCRLDYDTLGQSVEQVMTQTRRQIDLCVDDHRRVHFVGHSLGGLVIRHYLDKTPRLQRDRRLGEVVLMGTPNGGSEVADKLKDGMLIGLAGGVSRALITGPESLGQRIPGPNYGVGIIAGTKNSSATAHLFSGQNDGLVSVTSTTLSPMQDFIAMEVSHTAMRYDTEVARQAIHYLRHGRFDHGDAATALPAITPP